MFYQQLATLEQTAGRLPEAEEWWSRSAEALRRLTAMQPEAESHQRGLARQLFTLGSMAMERGDQEAARRFLEESYELGEDLFARTASVENATTLQFPSFFLAQLLQESDPEAAQRYVQQALELDQLTGVMSGTGPASTSRSD